MEFFCVRVELKLSLMQLIHASLVFGLLLFDGIALFFQLDAPPFNLLLAVVQAPRARIDALVALENRECT